MNTFVLVVSIIFIAVLSLWLIIQGDAPATASHIGALAIIIINLGAVLLSKKR